MELTAIMPLLNGGWQVAHGGDGSGVQPVVVPQVPTMRTQDEEASWAPSSGAGGAVDTRKFANGAADVYQQVRYTPGCGHPAAWLTAERRACLLVSKGGRPWQRCPRCLLLVLLLPPFPGC